MAAGRLGIIDGVADVRANEGLWLFDDDDWALIAMLQDPVLCAELLFEDPNNKDYSGCYHVRDYQYPLFRPKGNYNIAPCGRGVGKSESIKARAVSHVFKRLGEGLLLSAPQMIHLDPLTKAVEARISATRLTRDFLKRDAQRTGFVHNPFRADFVDGTTIIGRIPHLDGPQPLDARVLTPYGWTTMGELEPGDLVIGGDGIATEVCEVHETGWKPIYELELSDGATVRASVDHRWLVKPSEVAEARGGWRVRLTGELVVDMQTAAHKAMGGPGNRWMIPPAPSVEYDCDDALPLDPYLLGVLLGDGGLTRRTPCLTTADEEIVQAVRRTLPADCELVKLPKRQYSYRITTGGRTRPGEKAKLSAFRRTLQKLGLEGVGAADKAVPAQYMVASYDARLALLQGLMDTDGTVGKNGRTSFASKSEVLARQVAELARSLGAWARVRSQYHEPFVTPAWRYEGGVHWRTVISTSEFEPVRLTRKRDRLADRQRTRNRRIVAVREVQPALTRCISVAAEHQTYLTDAFVTTLNTGVKGQHVPDLIIDEGQDYPSSGWTEVFPTVMKDHTDSTGSFDFTMTFYGVHAAAGQGGTFGRLAKDPAYEMSVVTRLQTGTWSKEEKEATAAMYGGTNSPDYRRNVLGEPGQAFSQFFATARLMDCMDANKDSHYNTAVFKAQELQAEEAVTMVAEDGDMGDLLDLPSGLGQQVFCGMDIGLVSDPTVIMVWAVMPDARKKSRLQLIRMIHLWRFTERQIRHCTYRIGRQYGRTLRAFGQDITGLGLPLYQAMDADELCPEHLREVAHGYVFNAKVPVAVARDYTSKQGDQLVDQYGHIVEVVRDKWTGEERMVARMTMIEASTRYLRGFVDEGFLLLPFHDKLIADFQGETEQRVKAMAGVRKKPSAFHMLDAARCMAMGYKQGAMEEQVYARPQQPVFERAVYVAP